MPTSLMTYSVISSVRQRADPTTSYAGSVAGLLTPIRKRPVFADANAGAKLALCQCGPSGLGDLVLHGAVWQRFRLHKAGFYQPSNQAMVKERWARPWSACEPFEKLSL